MIAFFFLNLVSTCTRRESDQDKMQSGGRENSVSARARTAIGSANLLVPSCRIANFTYSNSRYTHPTFIATESYPIDT